MNTRVAILVVLASTALTAQDGQWLVTDGLKPGEQVMVDGLQKLRGPGPVKPVPWQPRAASAAAASAPASAASGN